MVEKTKAKNNNTVILVLLFLASGLLFGLVGYLIGNAVPLKNIGLLKPGLGTKEELEVETEKSSSSPTASPVVEEESRPEEVVETGESTKTKTVSAYQHDFKFDYPDGWIVAVNNTDYSTGVEISKGDFKIIITQGDMGSARCVYPDEADYGGSIEGPHNKYVDFVQFQGRGETFRRSQYPAQGTYTVCSKAAGSTAFNLYSTVGFIRYETPIHPTETQLGELDEILGSMVVL